MVKVASDYLGQMCVKSLDARTNAGARDFEVPDGIIDLAARGGGITAKINKKIRL